MQKCLRFVMIITVGLIILFAGPMCKDRTSEPLLVWDYSGYVLDSMTAEPIESALVSIHDTSGVAAFSDSIGYFSGKTTWSEAPVFIRKASYKTQIRYRNFRNDTTTMEILLVPEIYK